MPGLVVHALGNVTEGDARYVVGNKANTSKLLVFRVFYRMQGRAWRCACWAM